MKENLESGKLGNDFFLGFDDIKISHLLNLSSKSIPYHSLNLAKEKNIMANIGVGLSMKQLDIESSDIQFLQLIYFCRSFNSESFA